MYPFRTIDVGACTEHEAAAETPEAADTFVMVTCTSSSNQL